MTREEMISVQDPKPLAVDGMDCTFGPRNVWRLLPRHEDLPESFQRERDPWVDIVHHWFFNGLKDRKLVVKSGIDHNKALAHCSACLRSWEPKHEHKIRGVAFLMSKWFEPLQPSKKEA